MKLMTAFLKSLGAKFGVAVIALCALQVSAQDHFPSRSIRLVVPYAAGGGGDALARALGPKLSEALKQTVIIDNKPGASGVIGTDSVIKAPPDGHTILLHTLPMVMVPAMFDKPPYDPIRDLTPVVEMIQAPVWLAVSTQRTAAKTVKELVDQVRAEPRKHNYASISPGSTGHLMGLLFNEQNKLDMEYVGYKGGAPATQALLAGEVTAAYLDFATLQPHLASGKIRLLGVSGAARWGKAPNVPTFKELGLTGMEGYAWGGLFVPRATSSVVVRTLADTVNRILKAPEIVQAYGNLGYEISAKSHEQFVEQVRSDRDHWGALVRRAGIKAQ